MTTVLSPVMARFVSPRSNSRPDSSKTKYHYDRHRHPNHHINTYVDTSVRASSSEMLQPWHDSDKNWYPSIKFCHQSNKSNPQDNHWSRHHHRRPTVDYYNW